MLKRISILLSGLFILALVSCDVKNGTIANEEELPSASDNRLDLYSENEGIHPNRDILDNPANPFANAGLNQENVWEIEADCPSPKAKFYLWGTMLTIIPMGEYQFYTALSLHQMYSESISENAREQAIKAYRALLDHFFDSTTWWHAHWLGETYYPISLNHFAAKLLYKADIVEEFKDLRLIPLYSDPHLALQDLGEWGYVYDPESGKVSRWQ